MRDIDVKYYKKLYVKKSNISGEGLFAGEAINKGELILTFGGIFALQKDRYSGQYKESTFVGISEEVILCESVFAQKDYSDYINHSCDPNIGMLDSISVVAIKNIQMDEELVCDYAFWETDISWKLNTSCKCGSCKCRKIITGKDWQMITPQSDVFEYFSPFLKRRIIKNAKKT